MRYALQPDLLAVAKTDNTLLTPTDDTVVSMTVAFGAVLGMLVQGHHLDADLSEKLMHLIGNILRMEIIILLIALI